MSGAKQAQINCHFRFFYGYAVERDGVQRFLELIGALVDGKTESGVSDDFFRLCKITTVKQGGKRSIWVVSGDRQS